MARRWIAWVLASTLLVPLGVRWIAGARALLILSLLLQLAAAVSIARAKSQTTAGRFGWSIGLWFAGIALMSATAFVSYVSFGDSFGR